MTKLLTGLAVGAAMFVGAGIAQAEPVTLTVSQMDAVSAAGSRHRSPNVAEASAYADAYGRKTYTNAWTSTFTTPYSSSSAAYSKSVSK